jgi:hypothetical protein
MQGGTRQLLGNLFIEHGRLVPPVLRDPRRRFVTNNVAPYGSKFGRHLSLMWENLIPHLRVLLPDLKWKKKVSPVFTRDVLEPMVDSIFLRVDLDRNDFCWTRRKESIAFFLSYFRLGTNSSCACAEQRTHQEAEDWEGYGNPLHRLDKQRWEPCVQQAWGLQRPPLDY